MLSDAVFLPIAGLCQVCKELKGFIDRQNDELVRVSVPELKTTVISGEKIKFLSTEQ